MYASHFGESHISVSEILSSATGFPLNRLTDFKSYQLITGLPDAYIRVLANNAFVGLRTVYLCIIGRQLAVFS